MHIHIFAIDALPTGEIVSSGGGLRSLQVIRGLERAGAEVTYSLPALTDTVRRQWDKLSATERDLAFSHEANKTHRDIINRIKPDAAVYLWPSAFTYPMSMRKDIIKVFDINGLQNVESVLANAAFGNGRISLRTATEEYVKKLSTADILITGSDPQRAYWSGIYSFITDSLKSRDMLTLPYFPADLPDIVDYEPEGPVFFCAGSFLPWNSPENHLRELAAIITKTGRGRIVIVGRASPSLAHGSSVNSEIRDLAKNGFVINITGMPYSEFSRLINGKGIGIDLNAKTIEREFSVPIRAVTFLAHGVPLLTNNYSTLSAEVMRAGGGWNVDTNDTHEFRNVVERILAPEAAAELKAKSASARDMIRRDHAERGGFQPLLDEIEAKVRDQRAASKPSRAAQSIFSAPSVRPPVVLIVTDDMENFLQLRIRIPFDAMHRAGLIAGYLILQHGKIVSSVGPGDALSKIDVVWVQRGPMSTAGIMLDLFHNKYIYDIDDNLLVSPSYRRPFSSEWRDVIIDLLAGAATVTTTTPRLVESLQRHSGVQIEHKSMMAPNMTDVANARVFQGPPDALLVASSDSLPLTVSRDAFFRAVNRFCLERDIPVLYVGPTSNSFSSLKCRTVSTGFLPYDIYRSYLRNENLIAIAPLESKGDPLTTEFVNCKSDIKMVEFGAAGIPAVYANVAPYSDSDIEAGPLVDCSDDRAIVDALDIVYHDADRWGNHAYERISELRLARHVAIKQWGLAIEASRLSIPVSLDRLIGLLDSEKSNRNPADLVTEEMFNERDYLAMNPDVEEAVSTGQTSAYRHYITVGAAQGRQWFPGTPGLDSASAAASVAKFRHFILHEPNKLRDIENRVADIRTR